jgi:hypothetical protein
MSSLRIFIKDIGKEFVFRGLTQKQTNEWYQAVSKAIYASEGNLKHLSYLTKYPRFWRVSLLISRKITSGSRSSEGQSSQETYCFSAGKRTALSCNGQLRGISSVE